MKEIKDLRFLNIEMIERVLGDDRVKYLTPPYATYLQEIDRSIVRRVMKGEFAAKLSKQVIAFVNEGVTPPKEIQTLILNIADDLLAGREPIIRAGDYIDLQNFYK